MDKMLDKTKLLLNPTRNQNKVNPKGGEVIANRFGKENFWTILNTNEL